MNNLIDAVLKAPALLVSALRDPLVRSSRSPHFWVVSTCNRHPKCDMVFLHGYVGRLGLAGLFSYSGLAETLRASRELTLRSSRGVTVSRSLGLVCLLAFASACSGGDAESSSSTLPTTEAAETSTTTTEAPVDTTVPVETSTTTSAPAESAVADGDVEALWTQVWQLAAQPSSTEADFEAFASAEAASQLKAIVGDTARSITNYPATSPANDDGLVEVHDCLLATPTLDELTEIDPPAAFWLSGEVVRSESGELQITSVTREQSVGCVPAEVADAAIADYLSAKAGEAAYFLSLIHI